MNQQNLLLLTSVFLCQGINTSSLELKQVLIFSRHNIRTPLETELTRFSSKKWPMRHQQPGLLTQKGALLEGYMGQYFKEWFKNEHFVADECPSEDTVYVYANSVNRTIATAEAFVQSAFKDCNVTVHHKHTLNEEMDPNFSPAIRNTTDEFKTMVFNEVHKKYDKSKLEAAFLELNKILDINNSKICKSESICDLTDMSKNSISFEIGHELWVNGPLYIGISVLDSFIMNYYEGLPSADIAWGLLNTPEKWATITEISRQDQNIRYVTVARDIGAPLVKYLITTFRNYDQMPKLILIVGHDYNQNSVFHTMGFKPIRLPNHYELFPMGGKIVFQRWTDDKNDYLKIEYIYPSWAQIRNGTKFSMNDPPQRVLLQLKWCNVDENGFCPWNEFINKLDLIQ